MAWRRRLETLNKQFSIQLSATVFVLLLSVAPVWAQAVPGAPTQVNPGLVTPEPTEETKPATKQMLPAETPEEVQLEVPEPASGVSQDESVQFEVSDIALEGNSVFSEAELDDLVKPYENRKVTLKDLSLLTEAIADRYRDAGYMTTQVYLPPQSIENGVVRVAIVEGTIGKIILNGNKYFRARVIRDQLEFEPGELLSIPNLENNLNNVNRNQPYRLKAVLSRGEETGQTDVTLDVLETQPWQVTATYDNQGRPFIGMFRHGIEVSNDSLLGLGDRLSVRWMGATGTQVAALSYNLPVHKSGTTLGYGFSFGYVDVDLERREQPRIEGYAQNHSIILTQPLNKSRSLTWDGSMNFREILTNVDHQRVSLDSIRSLTTGITYSRYDRWGRTFMRLQTDFGADWLGANRAFWKANAFLTRLVVLPKNNLVILRSAAQFSPDALPSAETFQIGGEYSVRGYTEGLMTGDQGYNFSAEWRWPIPGLRLLSADLSERIQGVFFADVGQVFQDLSVNGRRAASVNAARNNFLISAGTGFRFRLSQYLSGFVDFGFGLHKLNRIEPNGQPTMRVHFGLQSEMLRKEYKVQGDQKTVIDRIRKMGPAPGAAPGTTGVERALPAMPPEKLNP